MVATVPLPATCQPHGVAVNPRTNLVYVTCTGPGDTVQVIDATTNTVTASFMVGSGPFGLAVNPTTQRLYVAASLANEVWVVDVDPASAGFHTTITTIPVGNGPEEFAINTLTNRIYVSNFAGGAASTVSVIDGASNTLLTSVPVGNGPDGVAVDRVANRVWVANFTSGTISVIDGASNTVVSTIPGLTTPNDIEYDPLTRRLYVTLYAAASLAVIDAATETTLTTVLVGSNPDGVALGVFGNRAYVANNLSDDLSVVDTTEHQLVDTVVLQDGPREAGFNAKNRRLYVANANADSVSVLTDPGDCCDMTAGESPGQVTITGPGAFEMVFGTSAGGSIEQFYDLAEDPGRTLDLAGALGSSSDPKGLHNSGIQVGGVYYNTGNNGSAKLELLEATKARARVRQESFYEDGVGGSRLAGVKGLGDYSVYPVGRLGLSFNRSTTSPVTYQTEFHELVMHRLGAGPLSLWTVYFQAAGAGAGTGADDFLLAQSDGSVKTDFLDVLYQDWTTANGYSATANLTDRSVNVPAERINAAWADTVGASLPADASETWNFLTYFKPADLVDHTDPGATARSIAYRFPPPTTVGPGTRWQDAAENTAGAGDFFNEKESAHVFDFDQPGGLSFTIDASLAFPVFKPFIKARQWRSVSASGAVSLAGQPLGRDVDYHAEVKPLSRAYFMPGLSWHCTMESATACDPGTIDVGSGGVVSGGAFVPGRYGSGFRVASSADYVQVPFSPVLFSTGTVEFWYRPNYDSTSLTPHMLWYNRGGLAGNYDCFWLEHAGGSLVVSAYLSADDQSCSTGGTTLVSLTVPGTQYSWRAGEWVHLRTAWQSSGGFAVYVDDRLVGTTGAPYSTFGWDTGGTRIGSCNLPSCPGGGVSRHADGIIDEPHLYGAHYGTSLSVKLPLAHAGLLTDPDELLADPSRNYLFSWLPVDANFRGQYLYLGSDAKFHGLNLDFVQPGAGASPGGLQWEYWDGTAWANLETVAGFTDTTSSMRQNGRLYWSLDPPGWSPVSVDGGLDLYYVRVHMIGPPYSTLPIERQIRTDVLLFQYCGDLTASGQTFSFPLPTSADLAIAKSDGQTSRVPGDPISYTITVTNNGPTTLTSLFVLDSLPPGLVGASFTPLSGSYDSGTGEWTGLSLATLQSATLQLSGTIDPFARGSLTNTATVVAPAGTNDPVGANDVATDIDTLNPSADVAIVKTDAPDPAPVGGLLSYTLTVTNNGPSGATNVDVSDALPLDMDLDGPPATAITPSQGSCNYVAATRTVSCTLGNLAPAGVATVTIKVRPGAARSYDNTATVTHGEPDPVAANDSDSETTLVEVSTIGVRFFTATSTSQRNVLEWVNPTDVDYLATEIVVRGDRYPAGPGDGATIYNSNDGGSGGRWKIAHDTGALSNGMTFYYGAFVHRASAPLVSPGRFVAGRPFDHTTGPVKWAFATGATALAAPTVSAASVIATSNDKVVYAIERGTDDDQIGVDSGEWPASFRPIALTGVVQLRSPVVPVDVGAGPSNPVAFFGAQDGKVYVVDALQGGSVGFPWAPTTIAAGGMVQAAPAGIFSAFGGTLDYLLIGTRNGSSPNAFVALDPYSGSEIDRWDNGGAGPGEIGIVSGMAAVDYGPPLPPRVYFTNYERVPVGSTLTLRCFELASAVPVFNQLWAKALGDIASSPVLRGGRVLVGSTQALGRIHSFEALLGGDEITFDHMNGQVRGFIFPDRLSPTGDMYFSTDDYVWGLTETGGVLANKFSGPISLPGGARPSPVLLVPGSQYLYVGGSDGTLYELDTLQATPVPKPATLGAGNSIVGAPSYDREHGLVIVGTEAGIFYAVSVPLP